MFDKQQPIMIIEGTSYPLEGLPEYDFNEPDQDIKTSVLTGKKHISESGVYTSAKITLYSYTESFYSLLIRLKAENKPVIMCFYGDYNIGTAYKSPRCEMLIKRVKPFHMNNKYYADALMIDLISTGPYQLEKLRVDR